MLMHENTISYDDLIKYAALDREETFVTDVLEHKWEKTRTKNILWLRVRYHDDHEWCIIILSPLRISCVCHRVQLN